MSSWKNKIKMTVARIGSYRKARLEKRAVILCYHSIHPTRSFRSATPELFEAHLQWLKEHCDVVPLAKLISPRCSEDPRTRLRVSITFDDGYLDNYEHAFPLLTKHKISATFFMTVGLMERDPSVIERFRSLRQIDTAEMEALSWRHVREMSDAGMKVGSHTYSHPNLAFLGRDQLDWEIKRAKDIMEERIGQQVDGFAYPFGKPRRHFNAATVEMVQEAGYQYATAVCFRRVLPADSRWALPRFFVTNDDIDMLSAKIEGQWDWIGYFQEFSPIWMARFVSPEDSRL